MGVELKGGSAWDIQDSLEELSELAQTAGGIVAGTATQKLEAPLAGTFIGSGKADEIIALAQADKADVIVFDEALSPAQQRNWEQLSGLAVIDRQEVILEIFSDRAHTREATLQVALARMEYSLPRLTRAWAHLSRQRGKGKMGGEGETQLEQDRRIVRDRITHLKQELRNVVQQRDVQRRKRQRVPVPTCAVVGYTNAGKSTLLNALTGAGVLVVDKLFATLDPTTRQLILRGNQKLLVTDTVGFIRRLPHDLVDAFKATLEEVIVADFLVHVVDVTNPNFEQHHATTLSVLTELGAADQTMVTVFNKIDAADQAMVARARKLVPDALFVSARTREGLDTLEARCLELIAETHAGTELVVPHARYDVVARLHAVGHIQSEEQCDDGVHLRGRFPPTQNAFFAPFVVR